mmetsp:Transcript_38585/g.38105  ORF Transcript_38585/g.38105 Transcript_38585/m.38105 type:complete len:235 (+) Transcript_38585:564-1268(+)|eukprot:CAMPEP_0197016638 /NCGR_PEP_ID=MMETSP1380-20130617/79078_1 /TAXON_ID=5936 /ORGANISM="Euplotes crassus, Strain CT5" /LENGTH=234 /DNA_ID=CAMNT_0042443613 /DNA_START=543 /DNA_END=1247 /DNA_ORIENTATION=-
MAPEVLARKAYDTRQHDLYAAAIVLFVLATQHPPFSAADLEDKYFKRVYDEKWSEFWSIHSDCNLSYNFKNLVSQMLMADPSQRLTLEQIKQHEWFKGPELSEDEIFARFTKRRMAMTKAHHVGKSCFEKTFPSHRILTDFYQVDDGDKLLNIAVKFAKKNRFKCHKSRTYFRVQIYVEEFGEETGILISILRKPNSEMRAIEFKKIAGDGITFKSTIGKLREYLDTFFLPNSK